MNYLCHIFLIILVASSASANPNFPDLPDKGLTEPDNNKFMDPRIGYDEFMGRVTDRDKAGRVLKIHVDNNNTKFFKAGDTVILRVNRPSMDFPLAFDVKGVEDNYFTIYVTELNTCWKDGGTFEEGISSIFNQKSLLKEYLRPANIERICCLENKVF